MLRAYDQPEQKSRCSMGGRHFSTLRKVSSRGLAPSRRFERIGAPTPGLTRAFCFSRCRSSLPTRFRLRRLQTLGFGLGEVSRGHAVQPASLTPTPSARCTEASPPVGYHPHRPARDLREGPAPRHHGRALQQGARIVSARGEVRAADGALYAITTCLVLRQREEERLSSRICDAAGP